MTTILERLRRFRSPGADLRVAIHELEALAEEMRAKPHPDWKVNTLHDSWADRIGTSSEKGE